ncbi:MAG: patatin family protein, partial [Oscillospiraceae bacterium]|nr:patatin family protein [Oscillospiraceae bacterium]
MDSYTRPIIKGEPFRTTLPDGTALVCEGGGTRGFYSSGVFEAFMDAGWMFPYIIGVSAGAANALSYISGQRLRSRDIVEHYVGDPRYLGYRNMLKGSFFGMDFIFEEVPQKHVFFDWESFDETDVAFLTGVTDCRSGQAFWFPKGRIDRKFTLTRASCSVPFVTPPVKFEGYRFADGGVASPIPIDKSIEDGNAFHVVVLTQNPGYRKKPARFAPRLAGKDCLGLRRALEERHLV